VVQADDDVSHLVALQPLVGLAVRHRLWGSGRIVMVRGTRAAQFPAGIAIEVEFAAGRGGKTPFTVADLWGGGRFMRPALSASLVDVGSLLDALLGEDDAVSMLARARGVPSTRRAASPSPTPAHPVSWARDFMQRDDWVLLDSETTGLGSDAEIIDLAVLDRHGTVLLDTLLRPQGSIPPVVSRVHGLYDQHVRSAPTFPAIWPQLRALLAGRTLVAYNVSYDARLLRQTAARHGIALAIPVQECARRRYAAWRTATNPHGGREKRSLEYACRAHGIVVGGHRAAADCRATLALLRVMARS